MIERIEHGQDRLQLAAGAGPLQMEDGGGEEKEVSGCPALKERAPYYRTLKSKSTNSLLEGSRGILKLGNPNPRLTSGETSVQRAVGIF